MDDLPRVFWQGHIEKAPNPIRIVARRHAFTPETVRSVTELVAEYQRVDAMGGKIWVEIADDSQADRIFAAVLLELAKLSLEDLEAFARALRERAAEGKAAT